MSRLQHVVGWVFLLALSATAAHAQPFIFYRGIVNAASFAPQGLPNGSIARGSIFSIFGRNLGPAEGSRSRSFQRPMRALARVRESRKTKTVAAGGDEAEGV